MPQAGGSYLLYEDSNHDLWIGSMGSGLSRMRNGKLTPIGGKAVFLTITSGVFLRTAAAIVDDPQSWTIFGLRKSDLERFCRPKN